MDNINKVFKMTKFKDKGNHREYVMEDLYKSFLEVYDIESYGENEVYDNEEIEDENYELFDNDILKYFQYSSIHRQFGIVIV